MKIAMIAAALFLFAGGATNATNLTTQEVSLNQAAQELLVATHSGGTDKNGCHRDKKKGGRHCH